MDPSMFRCLLVQVACVEFLFKMVYLCLLLDGVCEFNSLWHGSILLGSSVSATGLCFFYFFVVAGLFVVLLDGRWAFVWLPG